MKQEINLEEILSNNIDLPIEKTRLIYDILDAMKEACNQCLDLAAENAEGYFPQEPVSKESILQIKDWIK